MKRYRGHKSYDAPKGGGKHIDEYGDGGEVYNYLNVSGKAYAYTRPNTIDIRRIGAPIKSDFIENVTVVWFAKNPDLNGQFIVGWFENAKVYSRKQNMQFANERKEYPAYIVTAKYSDCKLIPEGERAFELCDPEPGQNFVWYGNEHMSNLKLNQVWTYIKSGGKTLPPRKTSKGNNHRAFQNDIEKRKKVEVAAIKTAINYYESRGYEINDVQSKNYGWDLSAHKGNNRINIEVKGLSGDQLTVELTANEYKMFTTKRKNYFLFVVRNALSKKQIVNIFRCQSGKWLDYDNNMLQIKVIKTANLSIK